MKHYPLNSHEGYPSIVLANGEFPQGEAPLALIERWASQPERYSLACCDGAVNNLLAYRDILPDIVIGDLDSINPPLKERLGARLVHIAEQESNDLSKTIHYLTQHLGHRQITLLGATGKREDHTLANIALLPMYAGLVDELVVLTDYGYFRLIQEPCTMEVEVGTQISFFNFERSPLTVEGVHWALQGHTLPYLWSGTLNRCDEALIRIEPSNPILVYVANR